MMRSVEGLPGPASCRVCGLSGYLDELSCCSPECDDVATEAFLSEGHDHGPLDPPETCTVCPPDFGIARVRRCRVCGCTDEFSCSPCGCVWVAPDLCSRCDVPDDELQLHAHRPAFRTFTGPRRVA
jgi:hypothetical protein